MLRESMLKRYLWWLIAWLVISLLGGLWLVQRELANQRDVFETDARIVHRLLSQRVVQHDAVLATLALLGAADEKTQPEQRLPSVYPQILSVQRRDKSGAWADDRLNPIEADSRRLGRALLVDADLSKGRYRMMLGAVPTSYMLEIDIRSMVPWSEWPMKPETNPVLVSLERIGQHFVIQPGAMDSSNSHGWNFEFHKMLAAESQPFQVIAKRHVGWAELPWLWVLAWLLAVALMLQALRTMLRHRHDRHRAEELLRLGQVARLNSLGELAAGMAHELNQPLTAVLANTQAAHRLLDDEPPDLATARLAMKQAAEQARRASEVVGRLRRVVERPELAGQLQAVNLLDVTRKALYLLEPEFSRHQVQLAVEAANLSYRVKAEPIALEQIIHNLLMNALQALDKVPAAERQLSVKLHQEGEWGRLILEDSGLGIPADVLPHIFEPFFSTRQDGLGLGLSLCETLAIGMGGALTASNHVPHGAVFCLSLRLDTV